VSVRGNIDIKLSAADGQRYGVVKHLHNQPEFGQQQNRSLDATQSDVTGISSWSVWQILNPPARSSRWAAGSFRLGVVRP